MSKRSSFMPSYAKYSQNTKTHDDKVAEVKLFSEHSSFLTAEYEFFRLNFDIQVIFPSKVLHYIKISSYSQHLILTVCSISKWKKNIRSFMDNKLWNLLKIFMMIDQNVIVTILYDLRIMAGMGAKGIERQMEMTFS